MRRVGIDIVENARIAKDAENESFLKRVLSANELAMTENMTPKRKREFVAGRFACKEAIIKAVFLA